VVPVARRRAARASGLAILRADSAFFSHDVIAAARSGGAWRPRTTRPARARPNRHVEEAYGPADPHGLSPADLEISNDSAAPLAQRLEDALESVCRQTRPARAANLRSHQCCHADVGEEYGHRVLRAVVASHGGREPRARS